MPNELQSLLSGESTSDEDLSRLLKSSLTKDVFVQIGSVCALMIKGKAYEEKAGRIVQLMALNNGMIEFGGNRHRIVSAKPSVTEYLSYDFVVEREGDNKTFSIELQYATVRKMVERKVASFDPDEDHDLLQRLNDTHEDAFTINGKQYYIAGEQWTQSRPGYRDLILIPVGRTDNSQVMMTVSEKLIRNLIETGRDSFRLNEEGDELGM